MEQPTLLYGVCRRPLFWACLAACMLASAAGVGKYDPCNTPGLATQVRAAIRVGNAVICAECSKNTLWCAHNRITPLHQHHAKHLLRLNLNTQQTPCMHGVEVMEGQC